MSGQYFSHMSPKLYSGSHPEKGGCGVFAGEPIRKGELLVLWGGKVVTEDELDYNMPDFTQRVLQIDERLYLVTPNLEPGDCFNHSCDPNAGFTGQIGLVAMRNIAKDEEIHLDYAMCDSAPYDEFDCACGAPNCRGRITAQDWKDPELQDRYAGYFSTYLQKKIDALRAAEREKTTAHS